MLTLLVLQGPDKGRRFELPDASTLVGRDSKQLPLGDNTASRRHCEFVPQGGEWMLKDLGSANGTYVNGQRVDGLVGLKIGDQVRVGRTVLALGGSPGVNKASGGNVSLTGEELGLESSIMHSVASSDDSMVLAVPEPAAAAVSNLKILYQLGATLGSSFNVDRVLDVVMDLVFENLKADRGILMLINEKDELVPRVVRVRDETAPRRGKDGPAPTPSLASTPSTEKIHASRTIVNHVLTSGEGVLSSNAMADRRFSKGKSVHDLGIRSALCVPIKARKLTGKEPGDEIIGVIYIDSSVKNYTYAPDQLRLLTAIGLQAGLAIQNAKLYRSGLDAERLAAIGETTAALSHSIKNILQALRGGADVVEMGLKSANVGQATKGWRIVDRNLERIYGLTMNLLAYSREREPKLTPVDLRAIVGEAIELIAPSANEKGVMVVADMDPQQPDVPLDPDGMHQVVMNLLSNAMDAVTPQTGLIRVVCRYDTAEQSTVLEVIDNGSGVPPSMMSHMFELFHSTKGNRGTGIGLAVTKKIVEEHDGTIAVASPPGEGTTFTVKLPAPYDPLADSIHAHAPEK